MRAVIGIGNPGRNYIGTRHNVGFYILDSFAHKNKLDFLPTKSDFWKAESVIDTFRFLLIKPTTYVNNSGLVINELIDNFNLTMNDLLVIYDDVNLDTGNIRIRKTGSDGGHNGIKSIIYHLRSDSFPRIRVGVGKQKDDESLANYVLSKFNKDEINLIDQKIPLLQQLMIEFIANGYEKMLDYFSKESNTNSSNLS